MCDIYDAECPGCGAGTDMHLADYSTGRDEVEVFCHMCIPSARVDGVVWMAEGARVFVRALTGNARANWRGNHPNAMGPVAVEVFGAPRSPGDQEDVSGWMGDWEVLNGD